MKCSEHRDADAVGLCRSCGRALCPVCVGHAGRKLACKGACEAEVTSVDAWVVRNHRWLRSLYRASAIAMGVLTAFSLGGALFSKPGHRAYGYGFAAVFGFLTYWRLRRLRGLSGDLSSGVSETPPARSPR